MKPGKQKKTVWRSPRRRRRLVLHWCIFLTAVAAVVSIVPLSYFAVRKIGKAALNQKTESASMEMQREENAENILDDYDPDAVYYHGETYHYNDDIMTFLLMGIDKKGKVDRSPSSNMDQREGGQADALFLVSADPRKKEIFVIGINRNALAPVDVYDRYGNYITTQMEAVSLQHGFGTGLEDSCERQVKCVSELFYHLPIAGYAAMNMGAIIPINDAVGGVELPLLHKFPGKSALLNQTPGTMITLKGQDAYDYVHDRDSEEFNSASKRLECQKQYVSAFIPKAIASVKEDIGFITRLYEIANQYMVTDMTLTQAVYLATEMMNYQFDMNKMYSLEGEMVMDDDGFEKFHVDDDALYDLIMQLYYVKDES